MDAKELVFRVHALERMFQRHISEEDVRYVIEQGETIKEYPDDTPFPSRLVLGWRGQRPLHVVAAEDQTEGKIYIISAYEPDPQKWQADFRRKKG